MVSGYVYDAGGRESNEDALLYRHVMLKDKSEVVLAAVCDGMGGLSHGNFASYTCLQMMEQWFEQELLPMLCKRKWSYHAAKKAIKTKGYALFRKVNQELFWRYRKEKAPLGTTCSLVLIYGGHWFCFHIGDSRVYQLIDTPWQVYGRRLTKDHGVGNTLSRCLGMNQAWQPDFCSGGYVGMPFLLCSDGFYRQYDKSVWQGCLRMKKSRGRFSLARDKKDDVASRKQQEQEICKHLRELAAYNKKKGERDNMSALYVRG